MDQVIVEVQCETFLFATEKPANVVDDNASFMHEKRDGERLPGLLKKVSDRPLRRTRHPSQVPGAVPC